MADIASHEDESVTSRASKSGDVAYGMSRNIENVERAVTKEIE